ncbi:unnamed protein product [Taenia asiatica]|uniref:Uncharacterized protein n=1 Tax=Taenia asiatica TaxID=60517 RepID=A0A0R3W4R7_TAEAS|nr:unnamed protein product [Taenia asiatica]
MPLVVSLAPFQGKDYFLCELLWFDYIPLSLSKFKFLFHWCINIRFPCYCLKEELAAKLNAGPVFPFGGGAHRSATSPTVTTEHASIASGDTTSASLSPGSPSNVGSDSYAEGAKLRIRLNRQRKHRARTSQLDTTDSTGPVAATSALNRIVEEEGSFSSTCMTPPLISPKPKISMVSSCSDFECKVEDVSPKPRSSSSIDSDISSKDLDAQMKPLSQQSQSSFAAENIRLADDEQEVFVEMKEDSLSKPLQQSEILHNETSIRNSSSQGDGVKDQEYTWLSVSGETPCSRAFKDDEWLKRLSHKVPNRPVSMATEYPMLSTATPIQPSLATQKVTPPPSRLVEVEDGSEKETRLSPSLGVTPPTHSEPQKPEIAPSAESEPFLAVRLRAPLRTDTTAPSDKVRTKFSSAVIDHDTNRQSRVCDLVKVFQQGSTT